MSNSKKIISVHIHKTAGSTFHQILSRQAEASEIVFANLEGVDHALHRLEQMSDAEISRIKIIHGHFPFGWHRKLKGDYRYITFVRDPVKRLVSDYTYNKENALGHHHVYAKDKTLTEYLTNPEVKLNDNGMTRFIAGDFETPYGGVSEATFNTARKNIEEYFDFVGITERFDDSLLLLKYALGFRRVFYKKENVTLKAPPKLTGDEVRLLHDLTHFDRQLFVWLVDRFNAQMEQLPLLAAQRKLLKAQISLYEIYTRLRYSLL